MMRTDWHLVKDTNRYECRGFRIRAVVYQDGEFWRQSVFVTGEGELDRGEWLDRESAIRNANSAIGRLIFNRRFKPDCPVSPGGNNDDDEDDDDDDD